MEESVTVRTVIERRQNVLTSLVSSTFTTVQLAANGAGQGGQGDRLAEVGAGAERLGGARSVGLGAAGDNDRPLARPHFPNPAVGLGAVDPRRHDHVEDNEVRFATAEIDNRFL